MAAAAKIVEDMGADIVDVNMGCPVPKIAKHSAGCSLMKEPAHAARVVSAMTKAVQIPVTVKMRAGWNERSRNAPELAKMVQDAGAAAVAVHGRTAEQSYSGSADWDLVARIADELTIPVFGSGDCIEPADIVARIRAGVRGVLVGRGVLRNPWVLAQAADIAAGRPLREVTLPQRGQFLYDYIELLLDERVHERDGFRHHAPGSETAGPARGRERWVINKIRALCAWYSKGLDGGSHLRARVNAAATLGELHDIVDAFFFAAASKEEMLLGDAPDVDPREECASDETAQGGAHPTTTGDVFHHMSQPPSSNRHASHKLHNGRQSGDRDPVFFDQLRKKSGTTA
jgi:tRNA-dihydrouridine synthase